MIRVFARKTSATPDDELVYFDEPPLIMPDVNEIHVDCTFTWDKPRAEYLAEQWSAVHPNVKLGGVAYEQETGDFVLGRYIKKGYTITSRGCNNKCWFCHVPEREGKIREIPIENGWNLLDNNLLQCSEVHIRSVFAMLKQFQRQWARPQIIATMSG